MSEIDHQQLDVELNKMAVALAAAQRSETRPVAGHQAQQQQATSSPQPQPQTQPLPLELPLALPLPSTSPSQPSSQQQPAQNKLQHQPSEPQHQLARGPNLAISKKTRKTKKQSNRSRMVTGYIIYASLIRKEIIKKHPDKDFGEISKIVGLEWKNLTRAEKIDFEKKAQDQNSEAKEQFLKAASEAAAALTNSSSPMIMTGSSSVGDSKSPTNDASGGVGSVEKIASDERQLQHQQHHHYNQHQAAYYSQLLDQTAPILIRPAYHQSAAMQNEHMQQLEQQAQLQSAPDSHSPSQSNQHHQQIPYQMFAQPPQSHHQQQQPPTPQQQQQQQQQSYQLFQYHQQPTMVQYCNDPACCASGRYQPYPYPFSPPAPATTPSALQQQQSAQQSPQDSPTHEQYLFKRNNIIYRRPTIVKLRPKDAATQTDPVAWIEKIEKMSPKKELRFSDKFIEHISSLGGSSPSKIADAAECH